MEEGKMPKYLPLVLVPVIPLLIAASTPSVSTPATASPKHVRLYNQGVEAQKKGDYQRAVKLYQKALKAKPDFADALNNTGYSLRNIAKQYMDEAMQSYNKALQIQKDHQQALEYQGELYVWRGQLLKANENYKQLKRMNSPEAAELKEHLDRVLAKAKQLR
jgi:tetratricopeptide (TPR) repeat protein